MRAVPGAGFPYHAFAFIHEKLLERIYFTQLLGELLVIGAVGLDFQGHVHGVLTVGGGAHCEAADAGLDDC